MTGNHAQKPDAERALGAMLEQLTPRAPDDASTWRAPDGAALFGFRWLKTQPDERTPGILHSERGLAMTCDGHVFDGAGQGVTELLARFASSGANGWRGLDAQFALAIWDRTQARLSLARDPLGVRFLYYFSSPDGVVFSSELKSLLQHPAVPRRYDEVGVAHYLTFLNVPGPRTLFDGIRRVTAGSVVEITASGVVSERRFWDLLDAPVDERDDEAYYVEKTRALHEKAVRNRGVSGPFGALLSGGNDSSANVSLLARQGHAPLHTFTVGLSEFEGDTKYNDLHYARQVAQLAGTKHHEALLSTDEFLKILPQTIDAQDDLVSEPSSVFLFHALRMAKDEGVRVVVTGEANDELCCGHGGMVEIRDGHDKRWAKLMRLPAPARRAAALLAPMLSPERTDVLRRAADGGEYFWSYEIAWPQIDLPSIVSADFLRRTSGHPASEVVLQNRKRVDASAHGKRDYLNTMVYAMMQDNYFGNLMLSKLDLLSARLGLESRCPYTSPEYAHWVYNVPASLKSRDGWVKYFFKKSIEGVLPNDIIYRPKQGFRTPVQELFTGRLAEWARPILLETGFTKAGILRRDHLADLLERHKRRERDHSTKLWTAMVLNMWHERWLT
jgi:asparagine synthase (glutamine-hydrolysing)